VHQIFQGNCDGATIPEVLKWYKFEPEDGGDYFDSQDFRRWQEWHGKDEPAKTGSDN
jgi:phenol hydroxylase P3 protein